jgi:hypothetical protein
MEKKSRSVGTPRKQIDILDVVVLTGDLPEFGLYAGDKGQVVWVWPTGEVEIEAWQPPGHHTVDVAKLRLAVKTDYPKPPRHPACECGATTAYCEGADRVFCPRCDLWLDDVCHCTPEECHFAERALWQRRPSLCERCAYFVRVERELYESSPKAERSTRILWCYVDRKLAGLSEAEIEAVDAEALAEAKL